MSERGASQVRLFLARVAERQWRDAASQFVLLKLAGRLLRAAILLEDEREAGLVHQPVGRRDAQLDTRRHARTHARRQGLRQAGATGPH